MIENKAADESGVVAEYMKALQVEEVEKLRDFMGIMEEACSSRSLQDNKTKSPSQVVY